MIKESFLKEVDFEDRQDLGEKEEYQKEGGTWLSK